MLARVGAGLALSFALLTGWPGVAQAKTISDFWQVSVQIPPQLWDDGASLPFIMGNAIDSFSAGGNEYRIQWNNAAFSAPGPKPSRQGGPYGTVTAGLYDRPLTEAQLRKFGLKQRLLWGDADVIVAAKDSPVCAGLTPSQVDGVLGGSITDWRAVFPSWPTGVDSAVRLNVPLDYAGKPRWAFGRNTYAPGFSRTTDSASLRLAGGQVAVQKLSFVERYLASAGLCAVPVGGVAPSEQSTRDLTYPPAYQVYYVSRVNPTKGSGGKPAATIERWESLLFGELGRQYLTTSLGRARFLP